MFGGIASVVSTSLVKTLHGYGAALWLSVIAVVSCSALVVGYHPTSGIITKARHTRQVGSGRAGDVKMAAAGGWDGKGKWASM